MRFALPDGINASPGVDSRWKARQFLFFIRGIIMRVWAVAVLLVYSFWSSVAAARDVKIGDLVVRVTPPAGFCDLDQSKKTDSSYFDSMSGLMRANGFSLVVVYPDCGELDKARATDAFIPTKVWFASLDSVAGKATPATAATTCDESRSIKYSEKDKADLVKIQKEFSNGNSTQDSIALGVLEDIKDEVCYVATLQKVKTKSGDLSTMAVLYAVKYLKNNLLFLYQATKYVDSTSIPTALANLKIIYADFATANGPNAPASVPAGAPASASTDVRTSCPAGQRLEGGTCHQLWNSVAGGITKIRGTPHIAIGYSGLRTSAEAARESGLSACRESGGNCKTVGAWNEGCVYIVTGSNRRAAGWSSAATSDEATRKCRANGYDCKVPIGGCVD
jgi:hypothetical protein